MNVKHLLCAALLCTVGCAGTQAHPTIYGEAPEAARFAISEEGGNSPGWQGWIPAFFDDVWETFSINIGTGYGAGVHVQFTNLFRIGIGEYADFGILGVEREIWDGEWVCPVYTGEDATYDSSVWDIGARFGVGFGGYFMLHTWEVFDAITSLVCVGYWSLDED